MNNKTWSFTITGKGDEPSAVQHARNVVKDLRKDQQKITDARFILIGTGDSAEQNGRQGKIDLLESYGERSVPLSGSFGVDVGRSTEARAGE